MIELFQVIKKILTFILIPTSAFLYFDFFKLDIDWFNLKKLENLKERLKDLEKINQIQSLQLEDNKKLIQIEQNQQQNWLMGLDTQKILLYTLGITLTGLAIYLGYSYFNDGDSAAFNSIIEHSAASQQAVVENISKQSSVIQNSMTEQNKNILEGCSNMLDTSTRNVISALKTTNESLVMQKMEAIKNINELNTNLHNNTNSNITKQLNNITSYIFDNVVNKLNVLEKKVSMIHQLISPQDNSLVNISTNVETISGPGRVLGTGEVVNPIESPVNTSVSISDFPESIFTLKPDQILFKKNDE